MTDSADTASADKNEKKTGGLLGWLDDRTGYKDLMHEALYERIPGGARWRYVWGSTLVFTFVVQVITGLFLWTAYSPSAQTAWESVYYINDVMTLGWLVRGIHHFAAQAMVVLLALHLMQVIIDGAYRAPREVNFWLGLILMQIVLGLALTGYLLPWDQKGYYATQVSTKIAGATPVIGQQAQELVQGGPRYGHHTLTRFFALHAGILPATLVLFLALHLHVFRRHGVTVPDPDRAPETTFWPDQVLKDGVACLAVLGTVMLLAIYKGAELSAPANPAEAYSAARPEWYFLFLFQFLRFEWVEHLGLAFGAIYVPGVLMLILFLMPFIGKSERGHRFNKGFAWVMFGIVVALTALAFYNDGVDVEHQLALEDAHIEAQRVKELASRDSRIPVEGATKLLAEDPFIQGPKLFAKHCAACHRYNTHNGMRRIVMETKKNEDGTETQVIAKPTAADLGNFGTRKWLREVIVNYQDHFAPLARGGANLAPMNDEGVGSEMSAESVGYKKYFIDDGHEDELNQLIEFLLANSGRGDLEIDAGLAAKGRDVMANLESDCSNCHSISPEDEGSAPSLVKYGSKDWLKDFIANPGEFYDPETYSDGYNMPAYRKSQAAGAVAEREAIEHDTQREELRKKHEAEDKLSERELDLLVRWMTGDYYPTEIELPELRVPVETEAK